MRYFEIVSQGSTKALVFHDYLKEEYFCQTNSISFKKIFNNHCSKYRFKLIKRDSNLLRIKFGPGDYNWMEKVLEDICKNSWEISGKGEVSSSEEVDLLITNKLV